MNLLEHLDKNNLHHAYLIEGEQSEITPEIFKYIERLGIKTSGNPDFFYITVDFLKIKQALDLRSMGSEKSFNSDSPTQSGKKFFVLSINRFSKDAEGVLLKMFEEPIENTHFFIITPDMNGLTKTLVSRFYLIKLKDNLFVNLTEANQFLKMPLKNRIDFIKEFVNTKEENEENNEELIAENSVRSKAFKFLDSLEYVLHQKFLQTESNILSNSFEQIFKAREFLRQQGSPTKTLLESVALIIPVL